MDAELPGWLPAAWAAKLPSEDGARRACLRALSALATEVADPAALLAVAIDGSPHSPREWLAALAVAQLWLGDDAPRVPVTDLLGYIAAAPLSPEARLGWGLPLLVEAMLEDYGYHIGEPNPPPCQSPN